MTNGRTKSGQPLNWIVGWGFDDGSIRFTFTDRELSVDEALVSETPIMLSNHFQAGALDACERDGGFLRLLPEDISHREVLNQLHAANL